MVLGRGVGWVEGGDAAEGRDEGMEEEVVWKVVVGTTSSQSQNLPNQNTERPHVTRCAELTLKYTQTYTQKYGVY